MALPNPIARTNSVPWDAYQRAAFNGQLAAGLLVIISTVALAVIFITHTHSTYLAANYQAILTLVIVDGVSFLTFAVCSCMHYCGLRKMRNDVKNLHRMEQIQATLPEETPVAEEVTTTIDAQPIEYLKQVIIHPILHSMKNATRSMVVADCLATSKELSKKMDKVEETFQEWESLFDHCLDHPHMLVSELLRFFGPGKKPSSVYLRRVIAAFNSGDQKKLAEAKSEYAAILGGHDFSPIAEALKTKSVDSLMNELPALLEPTFCLPDPTLRQLGRQLLDYIFEKTKDNKEVANALAALKRKACSEKIIEEVAKFLQLAFAKAQAPADKCKEWKETFVRYTLDTIFKRTVCVSIGMLARNMRMIKFLLDKEMEQHKLFTLLDETFLFSESGDCIKREALQREMLHVQSDINYDLEETKRIALLALPPEDKRDYEALYNEEQIIEWCFDAKDVAGKVNVKQLQLTTDSQEVLDLGLKHGVHIIALPACIHDHPFKMLKKHEGKLKVVGPLLSVIFPLILPFVMPILHRSIPTMEGKDLARVDSFVKKLITVMIDPIYDGAVGDTEFQPVFRRVMTTQGEELAANLENLISKEHLTFELIRDEWTKALNGIARAFSQADSV